MWGWLKLLWLMLRHGRSMVTCTGMDGTVIGVGDTVERVINGDVLGHVSVLKVERVENRLNGVLVGVEVTSDGWCRNPRPRRYWSGDVRLLEVNG